MSEQLKAALIRGLISGVVSAGAAFFALLGAEGAGAAGIAAGSAFFGAFLARGFGEGTYDQSRQKSGRVKPGDVKR